MSGKPRRAKSGLDSPLLRKTVGCLKRMMKYEARAPFTPFTDIEAAGAVETMNPPD
jgi:hypothetical protein